MKEHSVVQFRKPEEVRDALHGLLREGAQGLIAQAVQAELEEFLFRFAGQRDELGRTAVVRNGYQPERSILTGIGPVSVRVPKVRSRGERAAVFRSALVPPYVRREVWRLRCRGCICTAFPLATCPRRWPCWWERKRPACRPRW